MATVILAGCDDKMSMYHSEVWSKSTKFSVPDSPIIGCNKPASVYFQNSIVMCSGDETNFTACYQYLPGSQDWLSFPSIPQHRERFTMTALDEMIVVVGGFKAVTDTEVYRDGAWSSGPMFDETKTLIHHCSARYGPDRVIVIGGFDDKKPTERTHVVDLSNHEVRDGPSMNKKRYSHACTNININNDEYIVVAGGFDDYHVCNSVEFLRVCCDGNYEEGHWTVEASMNIQRYDFGLTIYGTQLAAFGGQPTIESDQVEVYDSNTNTWNFTGEVVKYKGRHYFSAVSVPIASQTDEDSYQKHTGSYVKKSYSGKKKSKHGYT